MLDQIMGLNLIAIYDTDAFFAVQLFLTFSINYWIFKRMTGIRLSATVFLTFLLTSISIQYNIPSLTSLTDACFLLLTGILARGRKWTVTEYAFYSLFPVVISDLLFRLLGLYFWPLLLNLSVEEVGMNAALYLLTYAVIPPIYLLFERYLGLDLIRWRAFSRANHRKLKVSRLATISMVLYLAVVYLLINLEYWSDCPEELCLRLRMIWVLLFADYFILMVARLNHLSRKYLEKQLYQEREQHLTRLTLANRKIDQLYHELEAFKQSYQERVMVFSAEESQEGEILVEQVYQNVLRESAKEFERFRVAEEPALDNIQSLALRSLLSAKRMEARRAGISLRFDIPELISGFEINLVDLTLLVSIFFSNAIDESKQVLDGSIVFRLVKDEVEGSYRLVLENQTLEERVDLEEILQEENQKKLSGLNLHTARDILKKYPDFVLATTSGDYRFKQVLVFN